MSSSEFVIPQPSAENPTDGDVAVALLPRADRPAGDSAEHSAPAAGGASEHYGAAAAAAEDDGDDGSSDAAGSSPPASAQRPSPVPDKNGKPTSNPSTDLDHQIERLMQCE